MVHDASYKRGGRKIKNIKSGLIFILGTPGMRPKKTPANTNKMGYATFIFFANKTNSTIKKISPIANGKVSCILSVINFSSKFDTNSLKEQIL